MIAAGDDISLSDRTKKLYELFKNSEGRIKSLFSNALVIDESGKGKQNQYIEPLPEDEFELENMVRKRDFGIVAGSSHAWTRELFDVFGPLITPLSVEDSPIAFRAALLGQIAFTGEVLIKHRRSRQQYVALRQERSRKISSLPNSGKGRRAAELGARYRDAGTAEARQKRRARDVPANNRPENRRDAG